MQGEYYCNLFCVLKHLENDYSKRGPGLQGFFKGGKQMHVCVKSISLCTHFLWDTLYACNAFTEDMK